MLNSIDLEVKRGIVVIIGPSGTGKSTLLRCLNLLETPDAGNLAIDDLQLNLARASEQQAIELRKRASFVFQNYALFANKTALDNIAEGLITVWKQPKAEARATALGILRTSASPTSRTPIRLPCRVVSSSGSASAGPWPRTQGHPV